MKIFFKNEAYETINCREPSKSKEMYFPENQLERSVRGEGRVKRQSHTEGNVGRWEYRPRRHVAKQRGQLSESRRPEAVPRRTLFLPSAL